MCFFHKWKEFEDDGARSYRYCTKCSARNVLEYNRTFYSSSNRVSRYPYWEQGIPELPKKDLCAGLDALIEEHRYWKEHGKFPEPKPIPKLVPPPGGSSVTPGGGGGVSISKAVFTIDGEYVCSGGSYGSQLRSSSDPLYPPPKPKLSQPQTIRE